MLPLALLAGVGRGYLAPLGFAMLMLILAQVIVAVTGAAGAAGTFAWWLYADFPR